MINRQQMFILSPDVLAQVIDSEAVLLDMKKETYYGLNDVGNCVLELLKNKSDLNSIITSLLNIYDVEKTQLEIDICDLLQELYDAELIQIKRK